MAEYLAYRIIHGVYTYEYAIKRRPDLKDAIDVALIREGREDLIKK